MTRPTLRSFVHLAALTGLVPGLAFGFDGGGGGSGSSAAPPMAPSAYTGERSGMIADPNRKLQPLDQLTFEIVEDNEPAQPKQVSQEGDLDISPVGPVRVAGLTTAAATNEIRRRLEADYYHRATVRLSLTKANASASMGIVYLSGEFKTVGSQSIFADRPLTLSQAIINANLFTRWANQRKVKLTRMINGRPETSLHDVKVIIDKGQADRDVLLQDGDRIHADRNWVNL